MALPHVNQAQRAKDGFIISFIIQHRRKNRNRTHFHPGVKPIYKLRGFSRLSEDLTHLKNCSNGYCQMLNVEAGWACSRERRDRKPCNCFQCAKGWYLWSIESRRYFLCHPEDAWRRKADGSCFARRQFRIGSDARLPNAASIAPGGLRLPHGSGLIRCFARYCAVIPSLFNSESSVNGNHRAVTASVDRLECSSGSTLKTHLDFVAITVKHAWSVV